MINQLAAEAMFSASYVDNYIDSVENLPDDIARHLTTIRSIDVEYRNHLREVDHYYDLFKSLENSDEPTSAIRKVRAMTRMNHSLIQAQELGDEKMQIVQLLTEMIEHKTRQLDTDQLNLDIKEEMQQHRTDQQHLLQSAIDDLSTGGVPTPKRIQSPAPTLSMANGNGGGSSGGNGGGSSPNSERSGNGNQRMSANAANGSHTSLGGNESHRSGIKRSRRRNESVAGLTSGNIDLGGAESNSANEAGSSNIERKNSNASAVQKKNMSQNQVGLGASNSSGMGVGIGSGAGTGANNATGKKKKRRARGTGAAGQASSSAAARDDTPPPEQIDPDEPTYCVCNQISFGEMILCDNDLCPIEWFHFSCVSLVFKPKGKWYCPNCRGDRPNQMKPKSQFLKELERYNKEKEEKT